MPLETGTYVSDLSASNPPGADSKSQGDDHLRLIKAVLKATFPSASKAFRFPITAAEAAGTVNVAFPTDQNTLFPVSASGASRIVNLPDPASGGTVNEDGFAISVIKTDSSANLVTITASGVQTINGAATLVLSKQWDMALLIWAGTDDEWYAIFTSAAASETVVGIVERATDAEAAAGSDATRYISAAQLHETRADVASGATVDLGAVASNFVRITGVTTITSLGTAAAGVWRDVTFADVLTLTHHATNLILPGVANISTAANDRLRARSLGAGAWIVLDYTKADGTAIVVAQSSGVNVPARGYGTYTANEAITDVIPIDDTKPQNTEGFALTASDVVITLQRSTSRVRLTANAFGRCVSAAGDDNRKWTLGLFKDSEADALWAVSGGINNDNVGVSVVATAHLEFEHAPGAVGPFTYKLRAGPGVAGEILRLNGEATRFYGGAAGVTLIAEEIFI